MDDFGLAEVSSGEPVSNDHKTSPVSSFKAMSCPLARLTRRGECWVDGRRDRSSEEGLQGERRNVDDCLLECANIWSMCM